MKKNLFILFVSFCGLLTSQIGINTKTPDPSASLEVSSDQGKKGFLLPRVTTEQRNAIQNPAAGLQVFNTTIECTETFTGSKGWFNPCNQTYSNFGIAGLNCASPTITGILTQGTAASNVRFTVPYTSGTGNYNAISTNSTGITGLVANSPTGTLNQTGGNLSFDVTGTPTASGDTYFNFTLSGAVCSVKMPVKSIISDPDFTIPTSWLGYDNHMGNFIINGQTITVTSSFIGSPYKYTTNYGYCNTKETQGGIHIGYEYSNGVVLKFSKPITNIKLIIGGTGNDELFTFTTNNSIVPKVTPFGGNCSSRWLSVANNKLSVSYDSNNTTIGTYVNIGGDYFTELTIMHNGMAWGSVIGYNYTTGSSVQ